MQTQDTMDNAIRPASRQDVSAIEHMVIAAYSKYIERIGKPPAPMTTDYALRVAQGGLHVLEMDNRVVGAIDLTREDNALSVNNLVVDPDCQGLGLGRRLMAFAEHCARQQGLHALNLYTNELMHENIALYGRLGFDEVGRRTQSGFNRVYFSKTL